MSHFKSSSNALWFYEELPPGLSPHVVMLCEEDVTVTLFAPSSPLCPSLPRHLPRRLAGVQHQHAPLPSRWERGGSARDRGERGRPECVLPALPRRAPWSQVCPPLKDILPRQRFTWLSSRCLSPRLLLLFWKYCYIHLWTNTFY